jgi:hypothetical protein
LNLVPRKKQKGKINGRKWSIFASLIFTVHRAWFASSFLIASFTFSSILFVVVDVLQPKPWCFALN